MKALIETSPTGGDVTLLKGSGGVFEIERDGSLVYSKKASGRFPNENELRELTAN